MITSLIANYNVAGPRYTSYPTVPFWNTTAFNQPDWLHRLSTAFTLSNTREGISLYIHLPYCESLCTFCGCNKHITRNHGVEEPYIDALLTEWALYVDLLTQGNPSSRPRIAELHLGGGTPSFFAPDQLRRLLAGIFRIADPVEQPDFGWEGHPNNTTYEHLQALYESGFRRVSFGVQDYDPVVQRAIHRYQPFGRVQHVTEQARAIGYTSISHDLVFGLPFQQPRSIRHTIDRTLSLRPDRISFYSYAHVPWVKGTGQRGFRDEDLPANDAKRQLYEAGRTQLEAGGYTEIGMDHFALPHDPLYQAMQTGTLHRNFMGYTTTRSDVLIGLGVSAISDVGTAFMQNEKTVGAYLHAVRQGQFPVLRGHLLNNDDRWIRQQIMNIMCRFRTSWSAQDWTTAAWSVLTRQLDPLRADGLIQYDETGLHVQPAGRPFLRNICMAFDRYLHSEPVGKALFSQTV